MDERNIRARQMAHVDEGLRLDYQDYDYDEIMQNYQD